MRHHVSVTATFALALLAGTAQATNGYFTAGVGVKNIGMAGAGSADPSEVMIVATNPAGLAFVGRRIELGLSPFNPDRSYSTSPSLANGRGGAFTIGPTGSRAGTVYLKSPTSPGVTDSIRRTASPWRSTDGAA